MTTLTRQDLNFGQGREAEPVDPGLGGEGEPAGFPSSLASVPSVVADVLCEFLEVAVHLILYVREVYPVGIFQKRKKYNVPVQVNPHIWAGATGSPANLEEGRGWIFEPSSTFRLSPLSPSTPKQPGLAFQFPASADSLTASHPYCSDFSFHPL